MLVMIRKDRLVRQSCKAMGAPMRKMPRMARLPCPHMARTGNGSGCRRRYPSENATLTAWARMVASAAPDAAIPKPPTNKMSSPTFTRQAMNTNRKGDRELPTPRNTPLIPL